MFSYCISELFIQVCPRAFGHPLIEITQVIGNPSHFFHVHAYTTITRVIDSQGTLAETQSLLYYTNVCGGAEYSTLNEHSKIDLTID